MNEADRWSSSQWQDNARFEIRSPFSWPKGQAKLKIRNYFEKVWELGSVDGHLDVDGVIRVLFSETRRTLTLPK